ncbi:MAG: glutamate racemase [Anaerolineales bacterium]|nr:glutamate racemase [Anaerolineales bacterium]
MNRPSIGIFDSGIGGLSVLREINDLLPDETFHYFADQVHVPFGPRRLEEIRSFSEEITRFLLGLGAELIVIACNTASAAALHYLREQFHGTPFVGMEPAVKPAALTSRSQRVGVLATPSTFQGELFASVVDRFAMGVEVFEQTLPGLVERIEEGDLFSHQTSRILEEALHPLLEKNVDTLVLACTHYSFVIPTIQDIAGHDVTIIDPAPAVARQTKRLFDPLAQVRPKEGIGITNYYSSADAEKLESTARELIQRGGVAKYVEWHDHILRSRDPD